MQVGFSSASVGGNDVKNLDAQSISTFNAGIFINFSYAGLIGVEPEILYSLKGYKAEMPYFGQTLTATAHISYIEIPVLFKLNVLPSSSIGVIKPNLFVGPEAAFKLRGKMKVEITGLPTKEQDMQNTTAIDLGLIFGAGADLHFSSMTISLDLRYDLGMRTLDSEPNPQDIKNGVLSANAGIGF